MDCELEQVDLDVNNALSSSHKRVNCNPASYYTPEPKRQQLSMPLAADNLPTLGVADGVFDENDQFSDDGFLNSLICSSDASGELFFDCELKNFNGDEKNGNIVALSENSYSDLGQSTESKNDVSKLLGIFGSTGGLFCEDKLNNNGAVPRFMTMKCEDNSTSILNCNDTERNKSYDINDETCKEEEDMFLRNLPTSVDDFQNKEFYLKLERNVSSPHVSRLQSPSACLPDFSTANSTVASAKLAMTGSSANSVQSSESGCDELDDNDLEVAMINESFEEQQKQSKIYDCMDLKSLFYGIPTLPPGIHYNPAARAIDPNMPSTSEYYATDDDFTNITGSTTPVKSTEFIPLLTPKSRQLLMRRRRPASQQQRETTFEGSTTSHLHDENYVSEADIVDHEQVFDNILADRNCNEASEHDDLEMEEEESRRLDMELEKMMLSSEENEHRDRFSVSPLDYENKPYLLSSETTMSSNVDFDSRENKLITRLMRQNRVSEMDVDVLNRLPFIVHMPLASTSNVCDVSSLTSTDEYNYIDMKSSASEIVAEEHNFVGQPSTERRKEDRRKSSLDEACRAAEDIAYGVVASLFDSPIPECFDDDSRSSVVLQEVSRSVQQTLHATAVASTNAFTSFCFAVDKENEVDDENSGLVEENNVEEEEEHSIELNQAEDDDINPNATSLETSEFCKNRLLSLKDDVSLSSTSGDMKKSLYVNNGFSLSSMNSSSTSVGDVGNVVSFDEQKVPVLDSWENLADDQELAAKVIGNAKSNFEKLKAVKNVERFTDGCSHDSETEQEDFPLHVLEANCQVSLKTDREVEEAIQFLIGAGSSDVWHKKVDDRNFLLVFPSAEKASEALFLKNSSVLKLKALSNASPQSRSMSIQWRSMLVGNKRRPATTATVARRMIANSLNIHIPVSDKQRRKETELLNSARDRKHRQNLLWDD